LLTDRTDLVLEVLVYLDETELLMAMGVCRRWRELAGARQLWQEKGEMKARDGLVNWAAFKNKGKIRQKRHSMVSFRFGRTISALFPSQARFLSTSFPWQSSRRS
jgi:hypothetical protein